ncbi:efflux RND transporter periplasmic adaptor subunit [Mucilaginibacter sp. Bleaf8]|uniref:efflux RND transporter periplasmic adaptor subunit n=1 Tax=Mucilaginibacter sp. Bleaf8 TaxID=2834430 RepID=UPI001BCC87A8|nr:efflux RND transporter periplasmic adaptor subunit [Mucilaginibacter sp. Bleaf8]MBS7566924.1 efflux RND transporter periplasmic adaptor subunit [Mucilaginibacter sp. Bleaf8]
MKPLALLLTLAVLYGCSQQPQQQQAAEPPSLPVMSISTGNPTTYQDYPASIEGAVNVEIRPQVEGTLDQIFVDEGAYVTKGQSLFKINDRPYREKLNNAKAALHAAEGAYANAQLEVEKLSPLVENKVVSDYQLKAAKAALKVAAANVEQARAQVGTAQIDMGYTVVKAPVSGYIGRLVKKQGSLVSPADAQSLTQLSDVHDVHVYFSLGETDFINFKEQYAGHSLQEKIKNLPPVSLILSDDSAYTLPGRVDMVDGQFDKTTAAITLRASFKNADGMLRSGNTGKVRLALQHKNVNLVPTDATVEMQDKVFVYTVGDSNKVSKQPITIIGKSGNNYLVKAGVKPGDRIVTTGIDHLQEGQVIKPEPVKAADALALSAKK